jgi:hypothetical protein
MSEVAALFEGSYDGDNSDGKEHHEQTDIHSKQL